MHEIKISSFNGDLELLGLNEFDPEFLMELNPDPNDILYFPNLGKNYIYKQSHWF